MTPNIAPIAMQAIAGHAAIRFFWNLLKISPGELIVMRVWMFC